MQNIVSHKKGYMLAAGLGVLGGGDDCGACHQGYSQNIDP